LGSHVYQTRVEKQNSFIYNEKKGKTSGQKPLELEHKVSARTNLTHALRKKPAKFERSITKTLTKDKEKALFKAKQFRLRSRSFDNKNKYNDIALKKEGEEIEVIIKKIDDTKEHIEIKKQLKNKCKYYYS
jgi:hypothetical protein